MAITLVKTDIHVMYSGDFISYTILHAIVMHGFFILNKQDSLHVHALIVNLSV